jgi:tetratricopeptide (TPR) repeat protein
MSPCSPLAIVDAAGAPASVDLLHTAADRLTQVGDVETARALRERAFARSAEDKTAQDVDRGSLALDHARALVEEGRIEKALEFFDQATKLAPTERDRAVVLGDIARIRADKGEVDAAAASWQEVIGIAGSLGDPDVKANALWSIAQIEVQQQKWQDAYDHLSESYAINLKLGRLDGICFVGLSLGQLLCMAGQREQGLAILTRSRDGFFKLGQARLGQEVEALIQQLPKAKS